MSKSITGKWSTDQMKDLMESNDKVLYGALKALYSQQTSDEQATGFTTYHNNVGFNGCDSKILSSMAEFLLRNDYLSDKQKIIVRKKLVKYIRQITILANIDWDRKHGVEL